MVSGRIFGTTGGGRGEGASSFGQEVGQDNFGSVLTHHELSREVNGIRQNKGTSNFGELKPSLQAAIFTHHNKTFLEKPATLFGEQLSIKARIAKSWHKKPPKQTFSVFADLPTTLNVLTLLFAGILDLPTTIHGLVEKNLYASVIPTVSSSKDLRTIVKGFFEEVEANLGAKIGPPPIDLSALATAVEPVDLGAGTFAIPSFNLPTDILAIGSVNLKALAGAHDPEDLPGILSVTQPENIPAYIIGGFSETLDLGASLVQIGELRDLPAFIGFAFRDERDLAAKLIVKEPKDLLAFIQGFVEKDLTASIITERNKNLRALTKGVVVESFKNLVANITASNTAVYDLGVVPIKAVIATNTGSNPAVPDLFAQLTAQDFVKESLFAFVRVFEKGSDDFPAPLTAVTPFINIDKLTLSLIPLLNLQGSLNQRGAFKGIRTLVKPVYSAATTTAEDAKFIKLARSFKFYLGTTKGLFIPTPKKPKIRTEVFINKVPFPDLRASIYGWGVGDLNAFIKVYPFTSLKASLDALDISHLKDFPATIISNKIYDLFASLVPHGGFVGLGGSITVSGGISDLITSIVAAITPLSFEIVSVSTQPFKDLAAIINYESFIRCASTSGIKEIGAYIKAAFPSPEANQGDIGAEINPLSAILDMNASITGRKRTRIRLLSFTFRARTPATQSIRAAIKGLAPTTADLNASVLGLLHEIDLPATLTAVRATPTSVNIVDRETVVNFKNTSEVKEILLSFRSQVNSYVFDEIANMVFPTDRGTWTVDLRTLIRDNSFFDLSTLNKQLLLTDITEFNTVDEAVRNAIVILTEGRSVGLGASITVRGAIQGLFAEIGVTSVDRMASLGASVTLVNNIPDIAASINIGPGSSSLASLRAAVTSHNNGENELEASVVGCVVSDLTADLNVV